MKTFELKPTDENIYNSFINDSIGRNKEVFKFARIINSLDESCSIAIDSPWGDGKTFFVKQVKMVLDANNSFIESIEDERREKIKAKTSKAGLALRPHVSVYYDAWENDSEENPLLSLIYSIISTVDSDFRFKEDAHFSEILKKTAPIIDCFKKINITEFVKAFSENEPDILESIRKNKLLENRINDFFDSLLPEKGDRLVIFVDELDRCRPTFAAKLLEQIKHYFTNSRLTFVFSVNTSEIQHTIKKYYGEGFDASRYLERFFDLRMMLPKIDLERYYQKFDFYENSAYDHVCKAFIEEYKLSLRETEKYMLLTKIAGNELKNGGGYQNETSFVLNYMLPVALGLKIVDNNSFSNFISGEDCSPLIKVMNNLSNFRFVELFSGSEIHEDISFDNVKERVLAAYNALFSAGSSNSTYVRVGRCEFSPFIKDRLLRIICLFSDFCDFDIE